MDAKPNMIKKYNKPYVGLFLGIALPLLSFFIYFLVMLGKSGEGFNFEKFIDTLIYNDATTAVISLCVLPNLLLFFLFKKLDYWYAIKGVIISILCYTLLVVVLKFA